HLRFGPRPVRSTYQIARASFVACHQWPFMERVDVLGTAAPGATFLVNSPYGPEEVWDHLPREAQEQILAKRLRFFVIDAYRVTAAHGRPPVVPPEAPDFVQRVTATMLRNQGDLLPVSAFPPDGTWPLGTTRWEKRRIALEIPQWDAPLCIQCNKCVLVCPHAA